MNIYLYLVVIVVALILLAGVAFGQACDGWLTCSNKSACHAEHRVLDTTDSEPDTRVLGEFWGQKETQGRAWEIHACAPEKRLDSVIELL